MRLAPALLLVAMLGLPGCFTLHLCDWAIREQGERPHPAAVLPGLPRVHLRAGPRYGPRSRLGIAMPEGLVVGFALLPALALDVVTSPVQIVFGFVPFGTRGRDSLHGAWAREIAAGK